MLRFAKCVRPATPQEAYELLQRHAGARIVGGGLWRRLSNRSIPCAVDLSACGLDSIDEGDDAFVIGAMCSLRTLERHEDFNDATCHIVERAVRDIVGVQFRDLATVGGSLYGRFGFSDVLCSLLALDSEVKFTGAGRMSMSALCDAGYPRDVLERVVVHRRPYKAAYACLRRQATDFPVLNVSAAWWDDAWHVAVGARPQRAQLLVGAQTGVVSRKPSRDELAALVAAVRALPFGSNYLAGAAYRRHLAGVLAVRAVCEAAGRPVPQPFENRFAAEACEFAAVSGESASQASALKQSVSAAPSLDQNVEA